MNNAIQLLADSGKFIVEGSSLPQNQKELTKLGIDCIADLIQFINTAKEKNSSSTVIALQEISLVKKTAIQYGLDRVTLFPCPVNGSLIFCFKMDGGNVTGFCNALGISLLPPGSIQANVGEQDELIRQFGIILYLREA